MKKETTDIEETELETEDETQTVGDILRNARVKQGKTLNDVAEELCIRRIYLEAIENVEYKKLPVEPYGLGYVRNYAEYLGLNSARIVQSFKETAMPKINNKKNLKAIGDEIDSNRPALKHVLWGILALCAIAAAWYFYNYSNEPRVDIVNETPVSEIYPKPVILEEKEIIEISKDSETAETNSEQVQEDNDNQNAESKEDKTVETKTEKAEKNAPRIKIVLKGDSWIELKHGKDVLLAKVYHKGFEYEIPYNEDLEVSVGKQQNVQFYIDGKLTKVTTPRNQLRVKLDKFLEKR